MADHFCAHCGEKIVSVSGSPIDGGDIVWCRSCIEADGRLIEKAPCYTGVLYPKLLEIVEKDGYACWGLPSNVAAIAAIPKRSKTVVKEVEIKEPPKETIVVKASTFCKKAYYGTNCECVKCGTNGQVIPYRDVFGYKEKTNESVV